MKILIYSANFAPEPTGIGKYSGEMAEWFASRGHEVRVVAAPPYYPAWKVDEAYKRPLFRKESWRGCTVWRAPLWVPSQPGGLTRILHLLSFAISSVPAMLRQIFWRPDVVLVVAPAMVCAPMGWLTARLSGAQAWLHIQDFEVDVAFRMGLLKVGLAQHIVWHLERVLLRRFDVVSTISHRMMERLLRKGVNADRRHLFPNWVDVDKIRPLQNVSVYRNQLGIPADAVVALFSGTLGSKQGLMVLPEAARLLQHRQDIHVVICGDGVMKEPLVAACAGLARVHLLPLQDLAMLPELLGLADVHLLPQSPDAEDLVLPSKLTGMLSSGRPIVATCNPGTEIAQVVGHCGLVVEPENATALAHAIEHLADNPQQRRDLGLAARRYAEDEIGRDAVLQAVVRYMSRKQTPIADSEHRHS